MRGKGSEKKVAKKKREESQIRKEGGSALIGDLILSEPGERGHELLKKRKGSQVDLHGPEKKLRTGGEGKAME